MGFRVFLLIALSLYMFCPSPFVIGGSRPTYDRNNIAPMEEGYKFNGFDVVCSTRWSSGRECVLMFVCGVNCFYPVKQFSHRFLEAMLAAPSPLASMISSNTLDVSDSHVEMYALCTMGLHFMMDIGWGHGAILKGSTYCVCETATLSRAC